MRGAAYIPILEVEREPSAAGCQTNREGSYGRTRRRRRIRSNARTGKIEAKDQFEVEALVVWDGVRASHRSRMGIGFAATFSGQMLNEPRKNLSDKKR